MTETDLIRAIAQRENVTGRRPVRLLVNPADKEQILHDLGGGFTPVSWTLRLRVNGIDVIGSDAVPPGRIVAIDDATEGLLSKD